jgi:hypothetical protein
VANYPLDFLLKVDEVDYHENEEFMSSHKMIDFIKCPLLYHKRQTGEIPKPESADMAFGSALHVMTLEPERFGAEYIVSDGPINPKTRNAYGRDTKAFAEWAAAQPAGKQILTKAERTILIEMHEMIVCNFGAAELLHGPGVAEGTAFVNLDGFDCKVRLDWFSAKSGIVDIKTCRDIDRFKWDLQEYRFDLQMAFYLMAVVKLIGEKVQVHIIYVEKQEPYRSIVFQLAEDTLAPAVGQIHGGFERLKECQKKGKWPTGCEGIKLYQPYKY